jgi:microsomal dipeptidase-like Zn-dependent dipeptidase
MHLPSAADEASASTNPALTSMVRRRPGWVDKLRAWLLKWAARNFSDTTEQSGWRVSYDRIRAGGVKLVFSVLYQPFAEMDLGSWPEGDPQSGYFKDLEAQLDAVRTELETHGEEGVDYVLVRGPEDLERATEKDLVAFVHCVEGGFHLGSTPGEVAANVHLLAQEGVAYVTLAHLFFRQVAKNAPAIPFLSDRVYSLLFWQWGRSALTPLGRAAVEAMYHDRVLIDISHMREDAVHELFDLIEELDALHGNQPEDYPVIATHVGVRSQVHQQYNLSPETIRRIAGRGGVIGLILAKHQLVADPDGPRPATPEESMDVIKGHIDEIAKVTDGYANVGIGSDLDGFIKPTLTGFQNADDLARLRAGLADLYPDHADDIAFANALRVLSVALRDRPDEACVPRP